MVDLNKLSPAALSAAMRSGSIEWGERASVFEHVVYVEPQDARGRYYLKCRCGCEGKAEYRAMANGICMSEGCELSMRRFAAATRNAASPARVP
jgi:hypothetical protein